MSLSDSAADAPGPLIVPDLVRRLARGGIAPARMERTGSVPRAECNFSSAAIVTPTMDAVGLSTRAAAHLPRNLVHSMDRLAGAELLVDYIPRRFLELYRDNGMGEFEALTSVPSRAEFDFYA